MATLGLHSSGLLSIVLPHPFQLLKEYLQCWFLCKDLVRALYKQLTAVLDVAQLMNKVNKSLLWGNVLSCLLSMVLYKDMLISNSRPLEGWTCAWFTWRFRVEAQERTSCLEWKPKNESPVYSGVCQNEVTLMWHHFRNFVAYAHGWGLEKSNCWIWKVTITWDWQILKLIRECLVMHL